MRGDDVRRTRPPPGGVTPRNFDELFDEDHRLDHHATERARAAGTGTWRCLELYGGAATRRIEFNRRTLAKNAEGSDGDHEAGTGRLAEPRAMQQHGWKG